MKKKTLVILALCLCLLLSWQVSALATAEPTVSLSEVSANRGDEVTIDVNLAGNPGIIQMKVSIEYDSNALELKKVVDAEQLGHYTHKDKLESPYTLYWDDNPKANFTVNGKVAQLTFKVKDNAEFKSYPINIKTADDFIYNFDMQNVHFATQNGAITVACAHKALTPVAAVEPTCVNEGNIAYYVCPDCGKYFADEKAASEITDKESVKKPADPAKHKLAWKNDADGHWQYCTVEGCNYTTEKAEHKYDWKNDNKEHWQECAVEGCNYTTDKVGHKWTWKNDATYHWQECTEDNCKYKKDVTAHYWAPKNDETNHWQECTEANCKYKKDVTVHEWAPKNDETNHWQECTEANCKYKKDEAKHTLVWQNDENEHWKVCSTEGCAYETAKGAHVWVKNEQLSTADKNVYTCTCGAEKELGIYSVTVTDGVSDAAKAEVGQTVKVTANIPASGMRFSSWKVIKGDISLANKAETTFVMPEGEVEIQAQYAKKSTSVAGGGAQTEFTVTVPKADNGSVGISQKEASVGTTITVSLTPAEGYKAGTLTVTDKNGNKLTLKSAGENKYTFTMPSANVDIKANFVKADGSAIDTTNAIVMQIGNKTVNAYGKAIASDAAPLIINNRTMVPIRIVTETLGGEAFWNEDMQTVTLTIDGKTITMQIGIVLEKYGVAPIIIDNRTYVPIRFVAEELGAAVDWNENAQEIVITK